MKSEYSTLTENLQLFLDKFHTYVMPSAETESMNLLVASQKNQTAAMEPDGRTVFCKNGRQF